MLFQRASREIIETMETSKNIDAAVVCQPTSCDTLAHSASGPALCSTLRNSCSYERPHTISSAYHYSLSRPKVTARTFEPPYGFVKAQASSSIYATPTNIYRNTADIYARPTLCGRRFSQGAVAVAPPVVPSDYAVCQKPRVNGERSADCKPPAGDKEEETMLSPMHRSCSLPSPVYNAVCNLFCITKIIFTALHGMMWWEFCPSVRLSSAWFVTKRKKFVPAFRKVSKIWTVSCSNSETVWDRMSITTNH